jgi:putative oxidoreductase
MNFHDLHTIWAPRVLSVLRIVAALLFLEHGTQKLLGFPPSPNPGRCSPFSALPACSS